MSSRSTSSSQPDNEPVDTTPPRGHLFLDFYVEFPFWNFAIIETEQEVFGTSAGVAFANRLGMFLPNSAVACPHTFNEDMLLFLLCWMVGAWSSIPQHRNRFQNRVWLLGQFFAPDDYANNTSEFLGNIDRFYTQAGAHYGVLQSLFPDYNQVRTLARASKRLWQFLGSVVCIECRRRKTLQHFAFDVGPVGHRCCQCFVPPGHNPGDNEAIYRWCPEWAGSCLGHFICGSCYIGRGWHRPPSEVSRYSSRLGAPPIDYDGEPVFTPGFGGFWHPPGGPGSRWEDL
jgi:hypothetical protein